MLMVSSKAVLSAVQMEYLKEGLWAARKVDLTEPQKAVRMEYLKAVTTVFS